MDHLLRFYGRLPKAVTLVRLMKGIDESTTDVACGGTLEQLTTLVRTAQRPPYHDQRCGWVNFQGAYIRLCHDIEPRDWLDPSRPQLTAATATQYPSFMVDVDAIKTGDSATEHELWLARMVTEEILQWISQYVNLSATLTIMSGNGYQILVRGKFTLDDQWSAAELMLRMKQRWPSVDASGFRTTVGPAVPGTKKCKGEATLERPHRMVKVEFTTPGDAWLMPEDLTRMIRDLPQAQESVRRPGDWGPALTKWEAMHRLPIRDALYKVCDGEMCPVCKSADQGFAILSENLCCCLHARRCPAAASGRNGFTAAHVYGYRLFEKWQGYSDAERHEICLAAEADGFELRHEGDELTPKPSDPAALQLLDDMFTPEPSRRKSIRPSGRWIVHGPNYGEIAEHMRTDLLRAYCPAFSQDHNDCGDTQPLVFDAGTWCYNQELGIYVSPLKRGDDSEEGAVERLLKQQVEHGILYSDPAGKPRSFAPSARTLLKSFEPYCSNVGYFRAAPPGIACRDGFLKVDGDKLVESPHSPANRAKGRLKMRMQEATGDGPKRMAAIRALSTLIATLLPNHVPQDQDTLRTILLEQWGACLLRMQPEVRMNFLLLGPPDVGKSVLSSIARALFERIGLDVIAASLDDINAKFPPLGLATAAASIIEEIDPNAKPHKTARLKLLAEGKPWSLDRKNRDAITCVNSIFIMATCNGEPSFAEGTTALAKRWCCVRFPDQAPPVLDHDLYSRFVKDHLDGLAMACVVAALRLVKGHRSILPKDSKIGKDTLDILVERCPIQEWFEQEETVFTDHPLTAHDTLYDPCRRWLEGHGRKLFAETMTPTLFTRRFNKLPGVVSKQSHGRRYFNVILPNQPFANPAGRDPSRDPI